MKVVEYILPQSSEAHPELKKLPNPPECLIQKNFRNFRFDDVSVVTKYPIFNKDQR